MARRLQLFRGKKSSAPTLKLAELGFFTDTRELFIGTGSGNVNISGSQWYTGTAMSGTSTTTGYYSYSACPLVKVGDIYLNTSNGNVYQCTTAGSGTTARWTYRGSIKGATGTAAGLGTPTATVDANTGTPSVSVTTSGSNTSKVFSFAFKNLKGEKGSNASTLVVAASDSKNKDSADYVCTGTNDQDTINNAINALPSGGGKIVLLEGTYTLNNGGYIYCAKSNVWIDGMGYATKIQQASFQNLVAFADGASNCKLSHVHLTAASGNTAYLGVVIKSNSSNCEIDHVYIDGCGQFGILGEGERLSITKCVVDCPDGWLGVRLSGRYQKITESYINCGGAGIAVEDNSEYCIAAYNFICNTAREAIYISTSYNQIDDNITMCQLGAKTIYATSSAKYNHISDNTLHGANYTNEGGSTNTFTDNKYISV